MSGRYRRYERARSEGRDLGPNSRRANSGAAGAGRVELVARHPCAAQLGRGLEPVGVRGEHHTARPLEVELGVVDTWRGDITVAKRPRCLDQSVPHAYDEGVGGPEMFGRAV